jgi:uracil-DNA glycosylase
LPGQLFKQLHLDWQEALSDLEEHIDLIEVTIDKGVVTPEFGNIFRALKVPLSTVKVVIFGQDPYPTAGVAQGLAFSAPSDIVRVPASLKNIFAELMETCKVASLGQVTNALFEVGGQYRRNM